jgi:hypothetical protein
LQIALIYLKSHLWFQSIIILDFFIFFPRTANFVLRCYFIHSNSYMTIIHGLFYKSVGTFFFLFTQKLSQYLRPGRRPQSNNFRDYSSDRKKSFLFPGEGQGFWWVSYSFCIAFSLIHIMLSDPLHRSEIWSSLTFSQNVVESIPCLKAISVWP